MTFEEINKVLKEISDEIYNETGHSLITYKNSCSRPYKPIGNGGFDDNDEFEIFLDHISILPVNIRVIDDDEIPEEEKIYFTESKEKIKGFLIDKILKYHMEQKTNFDIIREDGRLLMEFVRGSHLYGLNNQDSDEDTGGIFVCTPDQALGFLHYHPQESDERHDNTWYEIGEFARLICKSNPTVLEALFVPENKIIGEVHPWMQLLRDNREKFITKDCFNPFFGYAKSQIEKARGLNKKIVNPITEKFSLMHFCYTIRPEGGGTENLQNFLDRNGMLPKYCGVVALDHMHDNYELYYDFGNHIQHEFKNFNEYMNSTLSKYIIEKLGSEYGPTVSYEFRNNPYGYRGLMDEENETTQIRLSSIPKNLKPECVFSYNQSGFSKHLLDYKQYKEWERERNPKRYESNLDKNYDSKNMMHCFRLMHMAKEIAEGKGIILERTWDHDFLMDVRNHKYEYDEIIKMLETEKSEMEEAMRNSKLPEHLDPEVVNNLLIQIRKEQLK